MTTNLSVPRKTIKRPITFSGIGIHTGQEFVVELNPTRSGGVVFIDDEIFTSTKIPLSPSMVTSSYLCTTLNSSIRTIEHLLAALSGLGITDLEIYVARKDHDLINYQHCVKEIPILDGSADDIITMILSQSGIERLPTLINPIIITIESTIELSSRCYARLVPSLRQTRSPNLTVNCCLDVKGTRQTLTYDHTQVNFITELASAKTFCYRQDIDRLHQLGYGLGGNSANTMVLTESGEHDRSFDSALVNSTNYKFAHDNPIRHKVLDLIGDLYLLGRPIHGHIEIVNPNHELNLQIARHLY